MNFESFLTIFTNIANPLILDKLVAMRSANGTVYNTSAYDGVEFDPNTQYIRYKLRDESNLGKANIYEQIHIDSVESVIIDYKVEGE